MKKLVALALAVMVMALCLVGCNSEPTFEDAFEERGITFEEHTLSTASRMDFAGLVTPDTIEVYEVGYEGETVKEIYKTFYLNIEQYDQSQRESVKQAMQESFAAAEEFSSFTISHELTDKYYVMKARITGLDSLSILTDAFESGIVEYMPEGVSELKISDVETALKNNSFRKR